MTTTPDLITFLSARLDEDEAVAKAACGSDWRQGGARWVMRQHPSEVQMIRTDAGLAVIYDGGSPTEAEAAHVARHDPARVLSEVTAKRALIEEHTGSCCVKGTCCGEITGMFDSDSGDPCPVLLFLAAIWSDHPDYRREWAVSR